MEKAKEKFTKNKLLKWIFLGLLIAIFFLIRVKYTKVGTTERFLPVSSATLEVPKFSIYKEECCMFSVTFQSFQNIKLLQKELDNIMNGYQKIECGNNNYYYDKEHNLTITSYGVNKGLFLNEFYIVFGKGKEECQIENKK